MVIGFDGSRAFVKGRTGTENYSYQLLKALSKVDKTNQYIVYLRPGTQGDALQGWPSNFKFLILNFKLLWTQMGLAARTFQDALDCLFVPAHTLPLIRKPGLKTVVTVHDLGSEFLPSMHQFKQRVYLDFMQKFQLKTATKIISVSNATKVDLIKRVGINPEKVQVIYEGFDKKLFRPVKSNLPKNYYLFVGTVQPRKNLERLILAFSRQSSVVRLVIAGQRGWISDQIYALPKELGIEDRVKFLGYVPEKDLPALYSGAAALTFTSLFEGFGLPILEAQACGCPVLTSNVSSMPEVAGRGAIYVDPYSIDDIVKGMNRVKSQESRVKLMKLGYENIKRFSWEKCAKETLEVLENI